MTTISDASKVISNVKEKADAWLMVNKSKSVVTVNTKIFLSICYSYTADEADKYKWDRPIKRICDEVFQSVTLSYGIPKKVSRQYIIASDLNMLEAIAYRHGLTVDRVKRIHKEAGLR